MQYDKVYFQKETDGAKVKETSSAFGIYCSDIPFTLATKAKDLTSRDWYDEDGLDEYVPDELKMQAYEVEVDFICKGVIGTSKVKIKSFLDYLTGRDGSGVLMKAYCSLTDIGRRHVRFVELKDSAKLIRDAEEEIVTFSVVLQVNDPVTSISPSYGTDKSVTNLK